MKLWVQAGSNGVITRWSSSPVSGWTEVAAENAEGLATAFLREGEVMPLPVAPGPWAVFNARKGQWQDPRSPAERATEDARSLGEARRAGQMALLAAIGVARARLVTVLPGQDMIYLAKEAEARAWLADKTRDLAGYPLLAAEIGLTAPDADALAQVWLNLGAIWRSTAARLERLRLATSAAIATAPTTGAVNEHVATAIRLIGNSNGPD